MTNEQKIKVFYPDGAGIGGDNVTVEFDPSNLHRQDWTKPMNKIFSGNVQPAREQEVEIDPELITWGPS